MIYLLEIDYDVELLKLLRLLEEAKKILINFKPPKEISGPKKLSDLKLEVVGEKIISMPIEENDFDDDVLVPGLKLPKPKIKREKELKIEVTTSIEEKEKPIDMLSSLTSLKGQFQECKIEECEEEVIEEQNIELLFDQLDDIKEKTSKVKAQPALVMKIDEKEQEKGIMDEKVVPIALKLQEKITGEKAEVPQKKVIHELEPKPKKIPKPKAEPIITPSPKEKIIAFTPEPELEDELIVISKATRKLKEIFFDESITLDHAKKIVEVLINGPQTLISISELTDLVEFELYQAIELLKANDLLDITRMSSEDTFELPKISINRWNKYVMTKKEEIAKPTISYGDPEAIYTGLKPHCPNCKKIIELREIRLMFKGFEPDCPACGITLKPSDIGIS